eukprot:m.8818 g.8818  ORF g.8818 m.8818 type:complete len:346 (+) comp2566_c0_seq1:502-1539(+)
MRPIHCIQRIACFVAVVTVTVVTPGVHAAFGGTCTPPGNSGKYTVTTSANLDAIPADCSVVNGSIDVGCDLVANPSCVCDVTDLISFRLVERITGYLRVEGCHNLTNLADLGNLKVIEGRTDLYDDTERVLFGFALWIHSNNGLESLGGLQNLSSVGRQADPPGRVLVRDNSQLCGTEHIDWGHVVADHARTVFDVLGNLAADGGCGSTACSPSCGCDDKCFGPTSADCQGVCNETSDRDTMIIVTVIVITLLVGVVTFFAVLCRNGRLGCRLSWYGREATVGKVPRSERDGKRGRGKGSSSVNSVEPVRRAPPPPPTQHGWAADAPPPALASTPGPRRVSETAV